jgi:hypothetical protein
MLTFQLVTTGEDPAVIFNDEMESMSLFLCFTWPVLRKLLPSGDTPHAEYSNLLRRLYRLVSPAVLEACHAVDDAKRSGFGVPTPLLSPEPLSRVLADVQAEVTG